MSESYGNEWSTTATGIFSELLIKEKFLKSTNSLLVLPMELKLLEYQINVPITDSFSVPIKYI